ncbi:hypothetical protein HF086_007198 [Spodoptera exigua]|uniref:Neurotransmitter-gated ion-channel ligand-binding domain-containing protein n=1 Tax=Spodoptera exigua TaxID=7107 RepID=A0A922SM40_SPOEX|nr:hypothetical protein HF086_007198 [Spodoptera exigua]
MSRSIGCGTTLVGTCVVLQSWQEPRVRWNASEWGCGSVLTAAERLWLPDVVLLNAAATREGDAATRARLSSSGAVSWLTHLDVTAPLDLDLSDWPRDTQACTFTFGSRTYTNEELILDISEFKHAVVFEAGAWEMESVASDTASWQRGPEDVSVATWTVRVSRRAAAQSLGAGAVLAAATLLLAAAAALPRSSARRWPPAPPSRPRSGQSPLYVRQYACVPAGVTVTGCRQADDGAVAAAGRAGHAAVAARSVRRVRVRRAERGGRGAGGAGGAVLAGAAARAALAALLPVHAVQADAFIRVVCAGGERYMGGGERGGGPRAVRRHAARAAAARTRAALLAGHALLYHVARVYLVHISVNISATY